ncbi:MAG: hypothetical protein HC898_13015 [Phycisphaerales bacterium]|nr:hypothetical protein [Phycisphaerales bacterium]
MAVVNTQPQLLVFSDDWGRHPSSCQHLVRHLLPRYRVTWVNTIGMRSPSLSWDDLGKIYRRLRDWGQGTQAMTLPANLQVISPRMWPGFRTSWQRKFNARSMTRAIESALGHEGLSEVVAVTTLPIVADLVGRLPVRQWVYYCVDDFSVWPGIDGTVMDRMEWELVSRVDQLLAVSTTLQKRLATMGRSASLLTHGIDLEHWAAKSLPSLQTIASAHPSKPSQSLQPLQPLQPAQSTQPLQHTQPIPTTQPSQPSITTPSLQPSPPVQKSPPVQPAQTDHLAPCFDDKNLPMWCRGLERPILLFWGLIDPRLEIGWCQVLAREIGGTLILAGPSQAPPSALLQLAESHANQNSFPGGSSPDISARQEDIGRKKPARVLMPGAVKYEDLPALAHWADVLVMPYADLPVTRAMQPLKFKEYLAAGYPDAGKPVVARALPALEPWADAADLVTDEVTLVQRIKQRRREGLPPSQRQARLRLAEETWAQKALQLEASWLQDLKLQSGMTEGENKGR